MIIIDINFYKHWSLEKEEEIESLTYLRKLNEINKLYLYFISIKKMLSLACPDLETRYLLGR